MLKDLESQKSESRTISCKPSCSICKHLSVSKGFICLKCNLRLSDSVILKPCNCDQFELREDLK